jgi:hypothetical protein
MSYHCAFLQDNFASHFAVIPELAYEGMQVISDSSAEIGTRKPPPALPGSRSLKSHVAGHRSWFALEVRVL